MSYSWRDKVDAERLERALGAAGIGVWRDQRSIEADWSREIAYALAGHDTVCLLWSANSEASAWVKQEWLMKSEVTCVATAGNCIAVGDALGGLSFFEVP